MRVRKTLAVAAAAVAASTSLQWAVADTASAAQSTGYVSPKGAPASHPVRLSGADGYWTGTVQVNGGKQRPVTNARMWRNESKKRSDHGCKKVTVNNRYTGFLGGVSYNYTTWVNWCWSHGGARTGVS